MIQDSGRPPAGDTEFTDEAGHRWRIRILWGHPAPGELGIHAAAFDPLDGAGAGQRIGYVETAWLDPLDEEALREALDEADPAS